MLKSQLRNIKYPIEITLGNQIYSPHSHFHTLPSSRIKEFPIIHTGFDSELEFYSPEIRLSIYSSLEKRSAFSLRLKNMAYHCWFRQAIIWDTTTGIGTGASVTLGPITYPMSINYSTQINCSSKNKLTTGIGGGIIFNSFGSSAPINYVYKDNYHYISYNFEDFKQLRLGYFIMSELCFEKHFKNTVFGLSVFGQFGFRDFSTYRLRAKFNNDYWDGTINSKGDAFGGSIYIKVIDINKLFSRNN